MYARVRTRIIASLEMITDLRPRSIARSKQLTQRWRWWRWRWRWREHLMQHKSYFCAFASLLAYNLSHARTHTRARAREHNVTRKHHARADASTMTAVCRPKWPPLIFQHQRKIIFIFRPDYVLTLYVWGWGAGFGEEYFTHARPQTDTHGDGGEL